MASRTGLFFRIIYRSIYFLLYIILLGLLLITPGDAIERSLHNGQNYNIWIIAVSYVVTIAVVFFVYALRLYVNKTALNSIPKTWIPIERTDVNKIVYRMITSGLNRSAAIAHESKPRVKTEEAARGLDGEQHASRIHTISGNNNTAPTGTQGATVILPPHHEVWGEIEHNGWASPNSADLPNLQYSTVLAELPHLIEGKAMAMAPLEPTSDTDLPRIDAEAQALLQRMPEMSLRDYLEALAGLGVLDIDNNVTSFLRQYECARFSTRPISMATFRSIMHHFAEILRSIRPLNLDALVGSVSGSGDDWPSLDTDMDEDGGVQTTSRSPSLSSQGSVRRPPVRTPSANTFAHYRTAPNTPGSLRTTQNIQNTLHPSQSHQSFSQTRRPYPVSQPSSASLRSKASGMSTSSSGSNSVIRLSIREDEGSLPYVLSLSQTTSSESRG
jgi:hypothetical protein